MDYAVVKDIDIGDIPVVDIAVLHGARDADIDAVGQQLRQAAETVGFFYIRNHGIPDDLIERTFAVANKFFASPIERKREATITPHHRGFLEIGGSTMEGQAHADRKESFVWGRDVALDDPDIFPGDTLTAPNNWPAFLPEMRDILNAYLSAANRCGAKMLKALAASLGIEHDYFIRSFDRPISRGALVHYPPQAPDLGADHFGVSPHTDFGCMTLLCQDMTGGLRVQSRRGEWLTAHPIEGTLVVNVGDLLARWTNDRFQSTRHAVVNTSGAERLSIPVAVDPNWETAIEPVTLAGENAHYPSVRCGDYIVGRFDKSFAYRKQD